MKFHLRFITITRKDYPNKNLCEKQLSFTCNDFQLVCWISSWKMKLVLLKQEVHSLHKTSQSCSSADPHMTRQQIEDTWYSGSESIADDCLALRKMTCPSGTQFLTEAEKQNLVDSCLEMLRKPAHDVKAKCALQEIIHCQAKFCWQMYFSWSNPILIESFLLKTVAAKCYTEECLSNVWRQVDKHRSLNDLLVHHHTNNAIFRRSTC